MKKVILILVLAVVSNTTFASTSEIKYDGHPKKGYNYKKHYRQGAVKAFFTRVFNLNNCHGRLNVR
jgi:hypothetical protein